MFKMDIILDGRKDFKDEGVGISTDGVSASVHFIALKSCVNNISDEVTNLLNIERLTLTPDDCDKQCDSDEDDDDDCTWEDLPEEGEFCFHHKMLICLRY